MEFWNLIVTGLVAFLAWVLPKMELITKKVVLEVLKLSAQFPRSDKFKELHSTPKLCLNNVKWNLNETDLNELLAQIFEDMELAISGINFEIKLIIACVFANPSIFFLRDLDYIVISKMGVEVLVMEMEMEPSAEVTSAGKKKAARAPRRSRSMLIDITAYRSAWLNATLGLSGLLFGVGMALANGIPWKGIITEITKV
jgi:hypothetical protein